ncbi:hypothetical protein [Marinicella gelatinilytica]|uniref:hypothetical protein n=1 Tax=Marinicella gelatinilytica TaxID=2996017 RepID=UPI002260B42D|nr:hypothetical protein [Marinicella gelatinilytica]MCX7544668.1 hypothetical protein [Marinicella gelatinilytica]
MTHITNTYINESFHRILNELFLLVPSNEWKILPRGHRLTRSKTKYGMADSTGIIHINQLFINTDYRQLFEAVLRHEFAHLCIGLNEGHNEIFKNCELLFKGHLTVTCREQAKLYSQLIAYKYQLLAVLDNGREVAVKNAHRKHRKYTHYALQNRIKYYYQKSQVQAFKYIIINKSL